MLPPFLNHIAGAIDFDVIMRTSRQKSELDNGRTIGRYLLLVAITTPPIMTATPITLVNVTGCTGEPSQP
jgi:hypothetical protein